MTDYGEHDLDEAPTSTHIRRRERKYHYHKLSRAIGDQRYKRDHPNSAKK